MKAWRGEMLAVVETVLRLNSTQWTQRRGGTALPGSHVATGSSASCWMLLYLVLLCVFRARIACVLGRPRLVREATSSATDCAQFCASRCDALRHQTQSNLILINPDRDEVSSVSRS